MYIHHQKNVLDNSNSNPTLKKRIIVINRTDLFELVTAFSLVIMKLVILQSALNLTLQYHFDDACIDRLVAVFNVGFLDSSVGSTSFSN